MYSPKRFACAKLGHRSLRHLTDELICYLRGRDLIIIEAVKY